MLPIHKLMNPRSIQFNSIQVNLFHQVATHKQINVAVGVRVEPLGEETAKRPYGHLVCCHLTSTASVLHMCTTP